MAKAKAKTPQQHIRRAQELLEQVDGTDGLREGEWAYLRIQIAHLHLRAAEVSAKLPPEVRSVASSISAASLNQPVGHFGQPPGVTPDQVAGIVHETLDAEKRRGRIR